MIEYQTHLPFSQNIHKEHSHRPHGTFDKVTI